MVLPTGVRPAILVFLLGQLDGGLPPLAFPRTAFLVGGAVARIRMVVLAGGASRVSRLLLLAPGWNVGFWCVACL